MFFAFVLDDGGERFTAEGHDAAGKDVIIPLAF
jgi:hypothetical protein